MGGLGSGGGRPRAGRKWICGCGGKNAPVLQVCEACGGQRGKVRERGRVLPHPSAPLPGMPASDEAVTVPLDETQAPNDLSLDERLVWLELGALALTKGKTLTSIQAYPFRLLCANVTLERRYAKSVTEAGSANHRGMIQAIDRELLRFGLVDFGKAAQEKPKATPNSFAAAFGGPK